MKGIVRSLALIALLPLGLAPAHVWAQDNQKPTITEVQQLLDAGQNAAAKEKLEALSEIAQRPHDKIAYWMAVAQIAIAEGQFDRWEVAHVELEELTQSSVTHVRLWVTPYQYVKAQALQAQGRTEEAKDVLLRLLLSLEGKNTHRSEPQWYGMVAFQLARLSADDNTRARRYADMAIGSFRNERNNLKLGHALILMADLEWDRDKQRRAYILYDEAIRTFRWDRSAGENIVRAHVLVAQRLLSEGNNRAARQRLSLARQALELLGHQPTLLALIERNESKL